MKLFERWKKTTLANKGLVFSSVLMAFGTLFYAGAAIVQVCIMKQNARDVSLQTDRLISASQSEAGAARKSADAAASFSISADKIREETHNAVAELKRQANDTEKAIDAASRNSQTALEVSIQAAKLDQRAWVGVGGEKITTFEQNKQFEATVQLRNTGKMPAFHSRVTIEHMPLPGVFPRPCDILLYGSVPKNFGAIAPQGIVDLTFQDNPGVFSVGRQHDAIVNGKPVLYMCGRVTYWLTDEIIDSSKQLIPGHETTFCFQYDGIRREFAACESENVMN